MVIAHKMRSHLMDATYSDRSSIEHFSALLAFQSMHVIRTNELFGFAPLKLAHLLDGTRVLNLHTDDGLMLHIDAAADVDGDAADDVPATKSYFANTFLHCTASGCWLHLFPPNELYVDNSFVNLVAQAVLASICVTLVVAAR